MRRLRIPVLAVSCVMFFSIFSCGCKSDKSKKSTDETRRATALLDDFCAYLKSGKFNKLSKLIDGTSKEADTLNTYTSTEAKDILEAARKRLSYDISDVSVSEDGGQAKLSFQYFDVEEVSAEINEDCTSQEIKKMISDAKEKELEFSCALSLDEDWYVDAKSADEIVSSLFSFMKNADIKPSETIPTSDRDPGTTTTTTVAAPPSYPLREIWSDWYDGNYNNVYGFHESDTFMRYMVSFDGSYYGEEVTFSFTDANGNSYENTAVIENGDNIVTCEYMPKAKLPIGTLTCRVYDVKQNLVSTGTIEIFPDGKNIPEPLHVLDFHMIGPDGEPVPGYEKNTNYIAGSITLDHLEPDTVLLYRYDRQDNSGLVMKVYEGAVTPQSLKVTLPWEGVTSPEPGDYTITVCTADTEVLYIYAFRVLADGQTFTVDDPEAELFRDAWCESAGTYSLIDKISKKASYVYYHVETIEFYQYMEFTYEVLDGSGNKYKEGKAIMINSDTVEIEIPLDSDYKGKLSVKVYNPSRSLLCESSIEQEK